MSKVGEVGMEGKVGKVGKVREVGMGGGVGKRRAAIGVSRKHFFLSGRLLDRGATYVPTSLGRLSRANRYRSKWPCGGGVLLSGLLACKAQYRSPNMTSENSVCPSPATNILPWSSYHSNPWELNLSENIEPKNVVPWDESLQQSGRDMVL